MNWHKLSPAVLTLLVFLVAQVLGTVLLLFIGMLVSPELRASIDASAGSVEDGLMLFDGISTSSLSIILMAVDILAVLACYFLLRNIRLVNADDIASINWRKGLFGIAGGVLGAMSISVLTDDVELPDIMKEMSLAMSHNIWGILGLVIVGPIVEELLFREAIEGEMLRRGANPWVAIIISAVAFGTVHFNFAQGLYALPLGIMFGIIYYKTGNIILTALLHILNNGIAAAQLYTMDESIEDVSYTDMFGSTLGAYAFMALCGVLSIVLLKIFWNCYCPREKAKKNDPT